MATIALANGGVAHIDDDDAERVATRRWMRFTVKKRFHYVASRSKDGRTVTLLHRFLMNPVAGGVVDHINGDGLDNRRANLRVCSQRDNVRNRRKPSCSSAPFKGITRKPFGWVAQMSANGKRVHIGSFGSAEEAASAYDLAAVLHFGEFACLNFPHVFPEISQRKA